MRRGGEGGEEKEGRIKLRQTMNMDMNMISQRRVCFLELRS